MINFFLYLYQNKSKMFYTICCYLFPVNILTEEQKELGWILEHPELVSKNIQTKTHYLYEVLPDLIHRINMENQIMVQAKNRQVCKAFVTRHGCRFGKNCMFLHTLDAEIIKQTPCKFMTNCHKPNCMFGHTVIEDNINDNTCQICLSDIYKTNKRFGLLLSCEHKFCVECIRKHRSYPTRNERERMACPTCRTHSKNYFASKVFLSGKTKEKEYDEFLIRCSKKKCRYITAGIVCPNSYNCHFKHF